MRRAGAGGGSRGQAMVEFALVLPLLLVIIFMSIGVSLIYTVRVSEQKLAYDAARHVAKSYKARPTDFDMTDPKNPKLRPSDLIDGCQADLNAYDPSQNVMGEVQRVIDLEWAPPNHTTPLIATLATKPTVESVSTGPPLPNQSKPNYYCNQAVQVTIKYKLNIPGWETLASLYGADSHSEVKEIGIAARLSRDYENTPKDQKGPDPSPPSGGNGP